MSLGYECLMLLPKSKSLLIATKGLTVTLMLRSVGALIFGSLSDRYGRKWPFVSNLGALVLLELGTGFTHSLSQFLAVRALFGIAMGGKHITSLISVITNCI